MGAARLDHVFVFASAGAPEIAPLLDAGLRIGRRRRHAGQGTANACLFFAEAMLELIWVDDEDAVRSSPVAPLRLWERSRWRETGASPFGVCLRSDRGEPSRLPFATTPYAPPYLPPGSAIHAATGLPAAAPLLFAAASRWDPPDEPHALANARVTGCEVHTPVAEQVTAALRAPWPPGLSLATGGPLLALDLDDAAAGQTIDLRPALPLVVRW